MELGSSLYLLPRRSFPTTMPPLQRIRHLSHVINQHTGFRNSSCFIRSRSRSTSTSINSSTRIILSRQHPTFRPFNHAAHPPNDSLFPMCSLSSMSTVASSSTGTASVVYKSAPTLPEDGLSPFVFGGIKLTTVAHSVWQHILRIGDIVIDATCGNGQDTLILARLVSGDSQQGYVYGLDLQKTALDNTASLLDRELTPFQRSHVKLLQICHSKLDEVITDCNSVRMVVFNLGYLPGGDKSFITRTNTTLEALKSATNVIELGGLVSVIAYVGHPGGRQEYDAIRNFAAALPAESWVCSHLESLNQPFGPHLMFFFRK